MNVFICTRIQSPFAWLPPEEAFHCYKVLRKKPGDEINLIDGKGKYYSACILSISKNECKTQIIKDWTEPERGYYLHLAVAPTKNISRFEWFLEKATEIGVDEITPVLCVHSERKKIKEDRLQRILTSAVKQSLSATIPVLNPLTPFKHFIEKATTDYKIFAHLEDDREHLKKLVKSASNYTILIGPEGDFSEEEIEMLRLNNWSTAVLGNKRLRTETAGVVAAQIINGLHF